MGKLFTSGRRLVLAGFLSVLQLPVSLIFAQNPFPEPGPVFRDDLLPVVRLWLPQDSLNKLMADPLLDHEYPARFEFESGTLRESIPVVGLRIRGNTSRLSAKKSFKVSFNTFTSKGTFYELEKMNLNGEHNDPSVIRSKLAWDLYRSIGVPAPRANHVLLYVNDQFRGVYMNVEQIDEQFTKLRYGNKKGNLYKCLWPANLDFISKNPNDYKFMQGSRRVYELQNNELADDYTDLAQLIEILNNTPTESLYSELDKILNINSLLGSMVMDVFIGNWDGPFFNMNNFYLYKNTSTGKFEFVPYDLDNTFGIDWFGVDWSVRPVYNWSPWNQERPLYTRVLEVPALRREYTRIFHKFLNSMADGRFVERINRLRNMYGPFIATDPYYPLDYGWSPADFQTSFNARLTSEHVKSGLIPYLYNRSSSARAQLDAVSGTPDEVTSAIRVYPNPVTEYIIIEQQLPESEYRLYNQNGAVVLEGRLASGFNRINTETIPSGIYYLGFVRKDITMTPVRILVVR